MRKMALLGLMVMLLVCLGIGCAAAGGLPPLFGNSESDFYGTWYCVEEFATDGDHWGTAQYTSNDSRWALEFRKDGTYTETGDGYSGDGYSYTDKYEIDGETLTLHGTPKREIRFHLPSSDVLYIYNDKVSFVYEIYTFVKESVLYGTWCAVEYTDTQGNTEQITAEDGESFLELREDGTASINAHEIKYSASGNILTLYDDEDESIQIRYQMPNAATLYLYLEDGVFGLDDVTLTLVKNQAAGLPAEAQQVSLLEKYDYFEQKNAFVGTSRKDNAGNTYPLCVCPDSSYANCHMTFLIKKEYSTLSGTVFVRYKSRSTSKTQSLRIYGDGALLYESPYLGAGVEPVQFSIPIDGVNQLKFSTEGGIENYGVIEVGNLYLTK